MGDLRFDRARERFEQARREGGIEGLSPETALQALGALAAREDAVAANILTTRLLNQFRRSATLLRNVGEGVVALDDEGRVLFANPAAEQLLLWEKGALVGRDFHEAVHHRDHEGRDIPRERCRLLATLRESTEDAVHVNDHDRFERKDGSTFFAGFTASVVKTDGTSSGIALVFRDISEDKEHERLLTLQAIALESVPLPVFWIEEDGRIMQANQAAAEHLGHERDALLRMRVSDFDPEYPRERWARAWDKVKHDGGADIRTRHRTRQGRVVPVRVRVRYVEHRGDEFHVAVVQRLDPGDELPQDEAARS